MTVQKVLSLLRDTPARIADAVGDSGSGQLHETPDPGEWSANQVLAHLRACADVWGSCIERILSEDEPTIRAINPTTWIESTDYIDQDFRASLEVFTAQRAGLLSVLEALSPSEWSRGATVTGAGKPLSRTVHDYAQWLARHERPHIKQIARMVEAVAF